MLPVGLTLEVRCFAETFALGYIATDKCAEARDVDSFLLSTNLMLIRGC